MAEPESYPTSIRLDHELRDALARRAAADGRGLANYIYNVLKQHVAHTSEPKRKSRKS